MVIVYLIPEIEIIESLDGIQKRCRNQYQVAQKHQRIGPECFIEKIHLSCCVTPCLPVAERDRHGNGEDKQESKCYKGGNPELSAGLSLDGIRR
jgi:hypothetical protein